MPPGANCGGHQASSDWSVSNKTGLWLAETMGTTGQCHPTSSAVYFHQELWSTLNMSDTDLLYQSFLETWQNWSGTTEETNSWLTEIERDQLKLYCKMYTIWYNEESQKPSFKPEIDQFYM